MAKDLPLRTIIAIFGVFYSTYKLFYMLADWRVILEFIVRAEACKFSADGAEREFQPLRHFRSRCKTQRRNHGAGIANGAADIAGSCRTMSDRRLRPE